MQIIEKQRSTKCIASVISSYWRPPVRRDPSRVCAETPSGGRGEFDTFAKQAWVRDAGNISRLITTAVEREAF